MSRQGRRPFHRVSLNLVGGQRNRSYLSCLFLQSQQLVDGSLDISLQKKTSALFPGSSKCKSHLCEGLSLRDDLVGLLGEVLLGLQQAAVGHGDECGKSSFGGREMKISRRK